MALAQAKAELAKILDPFCVEESFTPSSKVGTPPLPAFGCTASAPLSCCVSPHVASAQLPASPCSRRLYAPVTQMPARLRPCAALLPQHTGIPMQLRSCMRLHQRKFLTACRFSHTFTRSLSLLVCPRALWPPRADPGRVHGQERHHRAGSLVLRPRGGPGAHPW